MVTLKDRRTDLIRKPFSIDEVEDKFREVPLGDSLDERIAACILRGRLPSQASQILQREFSAAMHTPHTPKRGVRGVRKTQHLCATVRNCENYWASHSHPLFFW